MAFREHLRSIHRYNVQTLRQSPLAELSGSLGDLGTLLPLMIAMTVQGSIDLSSTLVFSGLTNIFTGVVFGVPLPVLRHPLNPRGVEDMLTGQKVQPMKAIASVAISQHFSMEETAAAGLVMGIVVFVLSATGLLRWLNKVVPVPIVKGIQVGAGLALVISAGSSMILPLDWAKPIYDNRIWAIAAFLLLVIAALWPRMPYALIVFAFGLVMTAVATSRTGTQAHAGLWHPAAFIPSSPAWRTGAVDAAIPQLPLTTLNSILAVTSLSATLFPSYPPAPTTTSLGFSVAISNLIGCWFGAMPICHGSGGLAGQYRFGARSGASIIILGLVKLLLGLFVGDGIVPLLQRFPKALLGIMVLAAGVELAKVGQTVGEAQDLWEQAEADNDDEASTRKMKADMERERKDRWTVMLITVAGCLAFKNDAVGFLAGMVWYWTLRLPGWMEKVKQGKGSIRLRHDGHADQSNGLLGLGRTDR